MNLASIVRHAAASDDARMSRPADTVAAVIWAAAATDASAAVAAAAPLPAAIAAATTTVATASGYSASSFGACHSAASAATFTAGYATGDAPMRAAARQMPCVCASAAAGCTITAVLLAAR